MKPRFMNGDTVSESYRAGDPLRESTRFFYALKDPLRLRILQALAGAGQLTVTDLVRVVRVSQPLVSWHLGRLRAAGLVHAERDGRACRYSVNREEIEQQLAAFRTLLSQATGTTE